MPIDNQNNYKRGFKFGKSSSQNGGYGNTGSLVILMTFYLSGTLVQAQCAMCRAVLESNENVGMAQEINDGIVYLMAIPYVLVAAVFYLVYLKLKKSPKV